MMSLQDSLKENSGQKVILFGTGKNAKTALSEVLKNKNYSLQNIFFCDNFKTGRFEGFSILTFEQLLKVYDDQCIVVVTTENLSATYEICVQLQKVNIPYQLFTIPHLQELMHLYGKFPDIQVMKCEKNSWTYWRQEESLKLYDKMFQKFSKDFIGKVIDLWIYMGDQVLVAWKLKTILKIPVIYAYSTMYPYDEVIPIPDFRFEAGPQLNPSMAMPYEKSFTYFKEIYNDPYEDKRAFWGGALEYSEERETLYELGQRYPDILYICPTNKKRTNYVGIKEQRRFKYIIDIRGIGWTDRVKIALQLGRPLLLVDRPYKEYYFDKLVSMVHYVPVKEDLSDLIDKIKYLDEHSDVYSYIVRKAREFCDQELNIESVLKYLRDITFQHII